MSNRLVALEIAVLRLPFRRSFDHAAATRSATETVVVIALLADGTVGFGEGLPRDYVTGETVASVCADIPQIFAEHLVRLEPENFTSLLGVLAELPTADQSGRIVNTARCAVELSLLDAYARYFQCDLSAVGRWLGIGHMACSKGRPGVRVSGILGANDPAKLRKRLRLMRWAGLRDFKLKVGLEQDEENLHLLKNRLSPAVRSGKATFRADANSAWDIATAVEKAYELNRLGCCCLEQPIPVGDIEQWQELARHCPIALMPDESLLTYEHGEAFADRAIANLFNIRLSKNGGLIPALRLANLAQRESIGIQLGAMVGESGILAAAGVRFCQLVSKTKFTEICYGKLLLQDDISTRSIRFGYGGKLPKLSQIGLGINVDHSALANFMVQPPRKINLA